MSPPGLPPLPHMLGVVGPGMRADWPCPSVPSRGNEPDTYVLTHSRLQIRQRPTGPQDYAPWLSVWDRVRPVLGLVQVLCTAQPPAPGRLLGLKPLLL